MITAPDAFTAVFDAHYTEIHRYLGRRAGLDVAEDLAAETFLIAFRQRKLFDASVGEIRPWLYGIATNLLRRHRRAELRHYRALARTGPPPDDDGHDQRVVDRLTAGVTIARLAELLSRLSTGERDVVLLVAYAGLSYAEVAHALNVAEGTVASRLSRARTKMREALGVEA
ncbi:RNA polymerase sigma factor [Nonomuraea glycinis]|uniref:DNA-directed RNA polymerase sigma-70 factor n=1 Tax=Nonomuraea glycinis TaxID=2047744 RepID=A0A918A628_9ACTN|nr:RNA polymerase sigma factor [Nonomuraea glycinis]MCA2179025.1 RNA polymerase sigma factor [Nonomuraea glycinis]GGP08525.1 DNA-directed RNA polymerase sigma-70 factor [Nonomuraea glycinis]